MLAPLVMAPLGPRTVDQVRLGGVVRAGADRTRVVLLAGAQAQAGVAVEFSLVAEDGTELDVDAATDWLRTLTAAALRAGAGQRDSHGNVILSAGELGFTPRHRPVEYDVNYFTMLRQLLYGGGILWFEDICTLEGFLLAGPGRHRLYIKSTDTGMITGIDLPLTAADGTVRPGQGGTFPTVLPSLVRDGQLRCQPEVAAADDYCSTLYDLSGWVGDAVDAG
ncbi:hypothetical protein [Actinoplanes sp. URMC 104]|uniref:hypothetical protein n=1 Tax=Actinoplanes sp. URMC 104 TaxID=3423409 RepID=UPI003F1B9F8A